MVASSAAEMSIEDLHLDNDWLCAIGEWEETRSLMLLDMRNPAHPRASQSLEIPEDAVFLDIEQDRVWLRNRLDDAMEPSINGYTWNAHGELHLDLVLDIPVDRRFEVMRFPNVFLVLSDATDYGYTIETVEMWDFTVPSEARLMGEYTGWSSVRRIQVETDKVYVHAWREGISMLCPTYTCQVYEAGAQGDLELISHHWGPSWQDESMWAYWGTEHWLQVFSDAETASIRPIDGPGEALVRFVGQASWVTIAGGQWFLLDDLGVLAIDLTTPDAIPTLGYCGTGGGSSHVPGEICWGLLVNGDIAYLGSTYGLAAIRISEDGPLQRVDSTPYGQPTAMALAGSTLYTSDWESPFNNTPRLYIYDVQDYESPVYLANFLLPHLTGRLAAIQGTVYAASWEEGMLVVDVTDPLSPLIVDHLLQGDLVRDVMIWEDHLLVAGVDLGVYSIDDPENPTLVKLVDTEAPIHHLHRSGNHLYASLGEGGIQIFDLSDPDMPRSLGHDPELAFECETDGDIAYLRGHDLIVADVSDPSDIRRLSGHSHNGRWGQIEVTSGGLLAGMIYEPCLGHSALEMHPLHCTENLSLELEEFTVTPGERTVQLRWSVSTAIAGSDYRVLVEGDYGQAYSVDTYSSGFGEYGAVDTHPDLELGGHLTYSLESRSPGDDWGLIAREEVSLPTRVAAIRGAWPNPFNPALTIRVFQDVPRHARVAVHDVLGRLVMQLRDGSLPAGRTEIIWDGLEESGEPAASGVYFIRYEAGPVRDSAKVVLLR